MGSAVVNYESAEAISELRFQKMFEDGLGNEETQQEDEEVARELETCGFDF